MRYALLVPALLALAFGIPIVANWHGVASAYVERYRNRAGSNTSWHHRYSLNNSPAAIRLFGAFMVLFGLIATIQVALELK